METTLVLVHGSRTTAQQWFRYAELLPAYDLLTPELPGHGDRVEEPFTWEAALATIDTAVAQVEQQGRRAVVVGHSLGGFVAMSYAAQHPTRLAGLALLGCSVAPETSALTGVYLGFGRLAELFPKQLGQVSLAAMRALVGREEAAAVESPPGALSALLPAFKAVIEHYDPASLADVVCPVLLLNGSLDQLGLGAKYVASFCEAATVETLRGATHLFPITRAAETAAALDAFVDELP